ncbi:MAG: oligosaccharide flippase family protein [Acidobacteriia bacterium]|nr:oligosaccharide flippase family protein [Terriglobia bacterium]
MSLASRAVALGSNLAYVAVTARHFSIQDVAVIAIIGILAMLMDIGKGLGLGTYLLKHLPKLPLQGDPRAASLVFTYLVYSGTIPAVLALLSIAAAGPLSQYFLGSPESEPLLRLGLLMALLTVLTNTNILVLQARQEFGMLATQTILGSLFQRLFPVLPAFWLGMDLKAFLVWSCGLAAAGFLASCVPLAGRTAGARLLAPAEFWPESRHFYCTALLRFGSTQLDQIIVAVMFSPATLAVYYMLRRLYSVAVLLISSVIDALVPDLSKQAGLDAVAARGRMQKWVRGAIVAGSAGGALMAGNGRILVHLVLGEGYAEDSFLIVLFSLAAFSYLLFALGQVDLVLFHAPKRSLRLALVAALLNTALGPLLAHLAGLRGLPLAMSISYLLGLELVRRANRYPSWNQAWNQARLWTGIGAIFLAGLLAAAAPMVAGPWVQTISVNALILLACCIWFYRHWDRVLLTFRKPA